MSKYYCPECVRLWWSQNGVCHRCQDTYTPLPADSPIELRQFYCADCDHLWWKPWPVEEHNEDAVKKCRKCENNCEPVPIGEEIGVLRCVFECSCQDPPRCFTALCRRKDTAPCHACHCQVGSIACRPPRFVHGTSVYHHKCSRCPKSGGADACPNVMELREHLATRQHAGQG